jgi:hypothetical protein
MPEELLLAIVEYLALQDFINLITTCKYYDHELLGHVCQMLKKKVGTALIAYFRATYYGLIYAKV